MRVCTNCNENKSNKEFFTRKAKPSSHCKACELERIVAWRKANPDKQKVIDRRTRLKNTYGITLEQYEELSAQQDHCCAVCLRHKDEFRQRLAIDHDHHSGEVRGLLCTFCNHKIVSRHRRGGLLKNASDYLERENYTGWFVPPKKKKRKKSGKNSPNRSR